MAQDDAAAHDAEPLYRWWLDQLPGLFGAAERGANAADGATATASPSPVGPVADALHSTRELLDALYGSVLRALTVAPPGGQMQAFVDLVQRRVAAFAEQVAQLGKATSGLPDLSSFAPAGTLAGITDALKPVALNLERAYGGLADAFGLAPLREMDAASRGMAAAVVTHRKAQADYLKVVAGALSHGAQALTTRLAGMGQRGETVDTLLALVRLWAQATDEAMHAAMQSPPALDAAARLIGAGARVRHEQQRIVALVSESLNVPTRAELDEAFREIQQLKRELRRSRKSAATGDAQAPASADTPEAAPAKAKKAMPAKAPAPARSAAKRVRTA